MGMITKEEYRKAKETIKKFERQQLCNDCKFYHKETYVSGYSPDHNNEMDEDYSTACFCNKMDPRKEVTYFTFSYDDHDDVKKPKWCPIK